MAVLTGTCFESVGSWEVRDTGEDKGIVVYFSNIEETKKPNLSTCLLDLPVPACYVHSIVIC